MNVILKIIEDRELYSHLILVKLFISTKGMTNEVYQGNMYRDMKALFGDEFDEEMYRVASQYLRSKDLVVGANIGRLTNYGRDYLENFARSYQNITPEENEILQKKLPEKIKSFLGISADIITVGNFLQLILRFYTN